MDFSLDNYRKKLGIADAPLWANSPLRKKLYAHCIVYFDLIKSKIDSQVNVPINERKIILRRLAKDCSVDPSLLNVRRQPDLINFIAQMNSELNEYWISTKSARSLSGRRLKKIELIAELASLKKKLLTLESLQLAEALTIAIKENLTESSAELVRLNESLSIENEELIKRNRALNVQLSEMVAALNRLRKD